jgi:hypothetical protein
MFPRAEEGERQPQVVDKVNFNGTEYPTKPLNSIRLDRLKYLMPPGMHSQASRRGWEISSGALPFSSGYLATVYCVNSLIYRKLEKFQPPALFPFFLVITDIGNRRNTILETTHGCRKSKVSQLDIAREFFGQSIGCTVRYNRRNILEIKHGCRI